jgi:glycosyltransferase involved in cell wall biosynthesis
MNYGVTSMNILQVCPFNYGEVGGVSMHVKSISERLAKRHDVTVYATNPNMKYPRYEVINRVKVERFKCYSPSDSYFFSWEMLLRLRKSDFDIVHAHCYHALPMHFSTLAKCRKFIVTTHFHGVGHTPFRESLFRLFKPFGKRTLMKADKIIAVSEYEKSMLSRWFDLNPNKVVVVPNGVNLSEFSSLERQNHDYRSILYVGYLSSYKGPQYLIEVLPKLAENVVLEIVGNGPLKPYLERRARELRVNNRVRFYQNLSRRELLQKYADADVFVLLSMYEAYSIVVAEALAAGTPCIVVKNSALSEWIDGETCFGVNLPIDLRELAEVVNRVLNNRFDRRNMQRWIGKKIIDWNEVANRLEKIYAQ